MERLAVFVMACTAIALTVLVMLDRRDRLPQVPEVGDRFPTLTLADSVGQELPPPAGESETLVVFFSTSCVYCLESLPVLAQVVREQCSITVAVVFLDLAGREMGEWWRDRGLRAACAPIHFGSLIGSRRPFGVRATPTFFRLTENGRIAHRAIGGLAEWPEWLR